MEPIDVAMFYGVGWPDEPPVAVAPQGLRSARPDAPASGNGHWPTPIPVPRTQKFPDPVPVPRLKVEPPPPGPVQSSLPTLIPPGEPSSENGSAEKVSAVVQPTTLPEGVRAPRLGLGEEASMAPPEELPPLRALPPIPSPHDKAPMPPLPRRGDEPVDPRVQKQLDALEAHSTWLSKQLKNCQTSVDHTTTAVEQLQGQINRQFDQLKATLKTHWDEIASGKRARNQLRGLSKEILQQTTDLKDILETRELEIQALTWKNRLMEYHILRLKGRPVDPEAMKEARQYVDFYSSQVERRLTGQPATVEPDDDSGD